ncbi:MAG: ATP-binding protein [Desulfovibrio sp.]|jgi:chromosomal replication initiator protein|nr:ATP-binding protein [Desulfovibrio sp.]
MQKKWAKILKILDKSIAPAQLKVWLQPLIPARDEGGLVLSAKTEFVCAHVNTWFISALKSAATEVFGFDCPVRVECRPGLPLPFNDPEKPEKSLPIDETSPVAASDDEENRQPGSPEPCAGFLAAPPSSPLPAVRQVHLPYDPRPKREDSHKERQWRFSFDDFVVGPCNRLAHAASLSMCDTGKNAAVLFLSSPPGLGKTHLMQAVGKLLCETCNRRRPKVEYLTAEEFASHFIYALKGTGNDMLAFKARYRELDLLLLDDVHFLQSKVKTQNELLYILQSLAANGGKTVFSSSFAPHDFKNMDEQLFSRMSAGLLSFIEHPDEDTRRGILRRKASLHQIRLPKEVEDILAGPAFDDVRKIESCLHTLIHKARLMNSMLTPELAMEAIGQYSEYRAPRDIESIIAVICKLYGLTREQLSSGSRRQEYVSARNTAFYLARKYTDLSLEAIGRRFNRRHSTVIKGITWLERELSRRSPLGLQLSNSISIIEKNARISSPGAPMHANDAARPCLNPVVTT